MRLILRPQFADPLLTFNANKSVFNRQKKRSKYFVPRPDARKKISGIKSYTTWIPLTSCQGRLV